MGPDFVIATHFVGFGSFLSVVGSRFVAIVAGVNVGLFVAMGDSVCVAISFERWGWAGAVGGSDGCVCSVFVGAGFELFKLLL